MVEIENKTKRQLSRHCLRTVKIGNKLPPNSDFMTFLTQQIHTLAFTFLLIFTPALFQRPKRIKTITDVVKSTRLPPMWPRFDSRTRRHMWVEFVGSRPCSEGFSPGTPVFLPQKKKNISKF